jgi:hypothetical protein
VEPLIDGRAMAAITVDRHDDAAGCACLADLQIYLIL